VGHSDPDILKTIIIHVASEDFPNVDVFDEVASPVSSS
jgi:hypothetical protein